VRWWLGVAAWAAGSDRRDFVVDAGEVCVAGDDETPLGLDPGPATVGEGDRRQLRATDSFGCHTDDHAVTCEVLRDAAAAGGAPCGCRTPATSSGPTCPAWPQAASWTDVGRVADAE
jgi:hypothetical protein